MKTIRVGADFSGTDMPIFALRAMGIKHTHVFSSDSNSACKKILEGAHSPNKFYDDAREPKSESDKTDLYVSGFPCQPYSASGNHMGDEDPRALVDESLDYITSYKPLAIMMENVPTLETTHRTTLEKIKSRLHRDGYATKHTILNSKDFGVHQNRPRLYLVAVRKDKLKKDRKFLTLRVSPPAHPETTPRRVEVSRAVWEQRGVQPSRAKKG